MNTTLKNTLIVIGGIIAGGALNSFLASISGSVFPLPEGVDASDPESLAAGIHLFKPINFLMPFLAHALGTLLASFIIAKFVESHHYKLAMIPGFLFLIGGVTMTILVDAPTWFDATDLLLAYLPMAYIGYKLGRL